MAASGGTFPSTMVVVDPVALAAMMASPDGMVVRRLLEDGEIVKQGARRRVGVYAPHPDDPTGGRNQDPSQGGRMPGQLRESIVKRVVTVGAAIGVEVGSDDPIALIHHEGTPAHPITSRPGGPPLTFFWPERGIVVRTRKVNHPGTRPNRYLTDSLADLAGRY